MSHGYTRHGHRCCDLIAITVNAQPVRRARCGGPAICKSCRDEAQEMHSKDLWELPPTRPAPAPQCSGCGAVGGHTSWNCPEATYEEWVAEIKLWQDLDPDDLPEGNEEARVAIHKLLHPEERK